MAGATGNQGGSWQRMFEVNTLGLMIASKAAIPLMKARGGGHIVNISSIVGLFTDLGLAGYCASKFAVEAFSSALHLEVSRADRIWIAVIEPGLVETNLPTHIRDLSLRQSFLVLSPRSNSCSPKTLPQRLFMS